MKRVAQLKSVEQFQAHCASLGISIPIDPSMETGPMATLAQPLAGSGRSIGNRFCILPMEGWDGGEDGSPTELVRRRWSRFGLSGAKLIWGGEAVAVRFDGRANPHQLVINDANLAGIESLRAELIRSHEEKIGSSSDLLIGLQLTHSGRFARPRRKDQPEPRIVYRHPYLDGRVGVQDDGALFSDDDIRRLRDDFVRAAQQARQIGFDFVDIKHCHGYFGHELLSARERPGAFGGSIENRVRFLREVTEGIRAEAPGLEVGVRLSVFDWVPFRKGPDGVGVREGGEPYRFAFGGDESGIGIDFAEVFEWLAIVESLGIRLLCVTAGSPYYNPHIQRPALFPPSDGYLPPEDPLVGVARQIHATAAVKRRFPSMVVVGSAYSYLQDWLPNVAQSVVRDGWVDSVGLGRMVLSYPDLPADVLAGKTLDRKRICRTFSDCTTGPRNGLVSGCYPLDPFYKARPEAVTLRQIKADETG